MSVHRLPAVDAYIARSQPFAQPILMHLRDSMHRAAPELEEAVKWSRPFFVYRGVILGNMAAFKAHCSFGLWGPEMAQSLRADGVDSSEGMGTFGRITCLADLPPAAELETYVRQAAALIDGGTRTKSIQRVAKPTPRPDSEIPASLAAALKANEAANAKFSAMSPSCRREYNEWISGAKREETRAKRVTEAIAMIAEGRARHWRYERPSQSA